MFERLKWAAAAVVLAFAPATAEELRIGTASLGGAFYPMGQSILLTHDGRTRVSPLSHHM